MNQYFILNIIYLPVLDFDERSANITCQNFGSDWSVDRIQSKALVCTKDGIDWQENCDDCTTWRMIVWQDGGCENDIYCKRDSIATVAGKYYGGHSPCKSGNNYQECGVWVKIHPSGRKIL